MGLHPRDARLLRPAVLQYLAQGSGVDEPAPAADIAGKLEGPGRRRLQSEIPVREPDRNLRGLRAQRLSARDLHRSLRRDRRLEAVLFPQLDWLGPRGARSEVLRVGRACGCTCRSRWE